MLPYSPKLFFMKHILLLISFVFSLFALKAQPENLPLGHNLSAPAYHFFNSNNVEIHTGFKPVVLSGKYKQSADTAMFRLERREAFFKNRKEHWLWESFFFDDLISVEKEKFTFYANFLAHVESGQMKDSADRLLINTRGIEIKGSIGKKLEYRSYFRENFSQFRPYIYDWAQERLVIPGQGAHKSYAGDNSNLDYSSAGGYISFSPADFVNLQVGHGKHFIGEGYRSLLLSDNAFNYPYLRAQFSYGAFNYNILFAEFQDFSVKYYFPHIKKHFAANYLSYNYNKRFEIGLFEGIINQSNDTAVYHNKFPADYFIPLIGVKTATNHSSARNHLLTGINLKVKLTKSSQLYAQYALDFSRDNAAAYQAGLKIFDAFHGLLPRHRLFLQAEYNACKGHIYTHRSIPYQTWTHYKQELAHPLGTRFKEAVIIARYECCRFSAELKYTDAQSPNSFDIYKPEPDINPGYQKQSIKHVSATAAWTINPRTNFQVYAGTHTRQVFTDEDMLSESPFIFIGLKTGISNFYYDF